MFKIERTERLVKSIIRYPVEGTIQNTPPNGLDISSLVMISFRPLSHTYVNSYPARIHQEILYAENNNNT